MDKLFLISFCFALLTSQCVASASVDDSTGPVLPKGLALNGDYSFIQELPALKTYTDSPNSRNNSYMGDIKELQPVFITTNAENESHSYYSTESTNIGNFREKLPPVFIDFEQKGDVSTSATYLDSSQPMKQRLPLGNTPVVDDTTDTTIVSEHDKADWFYQEKKEDNDDNEEDRDKDGSDEYNDEGDDFVLGEHNVDDDDEEYDVTKWSQHGDDDDDDDGDYEDDTQDDFEELKNPVDELATKKRQPTAPTRMVLFYTWMVVAVLLIIVGVSTYQSRCKGFRFFGAKASNPKDDKKRLMEHEFV